MATCLGKLAEVCLERDKRYEVACLIYTQLLMKRQVKATKRADWWVRLAIDLKHLRLKKDSLRVCEVALHDQQWVKTGPKNQLLKIKAQLEKTLKRPAKKKKQATKKRKTKKENTDPQFDQEPV